MKTAKQEKEQEKQRLAKNKAKIQVTWGDGTSLSFDAMFAHSKITTHRGNTASFIELNADRVSNIKNS